MSDRNFENEIIQLVEKQLNIVQKEEQQKFIDKITPDINELFRIMKDLNLAKTVISKRNQLSAILGSEGASLPVATNLQSSSLEIDIYNLYVLVSRITEYFGIHTKIELTYTDVSSKGEYRRGHIFDMELIPNDGKSKIRLEKDSKGVIRAAFRGGWLTSVLKEYDVVSNHYKDFKKTLSDQTDGASNVNEGYIVEAFERHWEDYGHQLEPLKINDNGSKYEPIVYWILSKNNTPFYSGPDTLYSQVKNKNASLVSNINTVLNAAKAIQEVINNPNLFENFQKAFEPKKQQVKKFSKDFWGNLTETMQQQIKEALGVTEIKEGRKNIILKL